MAAIDLKSLVGRLNEPCRRALEAAAGLTLSRTHYNVELEHWLLKLVDIADSDMIAILRQYEVDEGRLRADLNRSLDRMKTGNSRAPSLAPDIVELVKHAWLMASVEHGQSQVRSGDLIWALLADEALARRAREVSGQFLRIPADTLKHDRGGDGSSSEANAAASGTAPEAGIEAPPSPRNRARLPVHDRSNRAGQGRQNDPILGRDSEIRQVVDILTRRRQNNPSSPAKPSWQNRGGRRMVRVAEGPYRHHFVK